MSFSTHIFLLLVLVNVCRAGWFFAPRAEGCVETGVVAARDGDLKGIQSCLDVGWDVNAKNEYGRTALHYAANSGKVDAIAALIKTGADVNVKSNNGNTALDIANKDGNVNAISLLKDALAAQAPGTLLFFLKNLDLDQYHKLLVADGYDELTDLADIDDKLLQQLGITKSGHRRRLLKGIAGASEEL